jgi:hypothetical protein
MGKRLVVIVTLAVFGSLPTTAAGKDASIRTGVVCDSGQDAARTRTALLAAVAMLPGSPALIAVMDVTNARPGVREYLLTLDAFTLREPSSPVIYVVAQSELLKGARTGSPVYIAMLAAALWHEMAHLGGADERTARRVEEELWTGFVRDGVVDRLTGLRYLRALKDRPDDRRVSGLAVTSPRRVNP